MSNPYSRLKKDLSDASKRTYESCGTALILWLLNNKPDLVTKSYKVELKKHNDERQFIKSTVFDDKRLPPLEFSKVTGNDIVGWLSSIKRPNGEWFGLSNYSNNRSAAYYLLFNYNADISPSFEESISKFISSIPRKTNNTSTTPKSKSKSEKRESHGNGKRKFQEDHTELSLITNQAMKVGDSWKKDKKSRRTAVKALLLEINHNLGDEKYLKLGNQIRKYHEILSSNDAEEVDENFKAFKDQVYLLLDGDKKLFSKFNKFFPPQHCSD